MSKFEYKAVPAPTRGTKTKGAKTTEDRFAVSITDTLNDMAGDGWEYVRAETLPCEERKGLTGTQTSYQNVLIFKRFKQAAQPLELNGHAPALQISEENAADEDAPVPRRLHSRPPEETGAPPLGAARDD